MALAFVNGEAFTSGETVTPTKLNTLVTGMSVTMAANKVLGTTGAGAASEVDCTASGRAVMAAASAAAQKVLIDAGSSAYVSTQFDKTNTTFADVTGLSVTLAAGTFGFETTLFITANSTGASKWQMAGTAVVSTIGGGYHVNAQSDNYSVGQITAFPGGGSSQSGPTSVVATMSGVVVVGTGGTLTVQFAQSSASGTSSVLVGSWLRTWPIS